MINHGIASVPRVNIRRQNEHILPEASIASNNALDLTGLSGEHGADNYAEGHRTRYTMSDI
jgi:hypothetical protein